MDQASLKLRPHVAIIAAPRSGGTFLFQALQQLLEAQPLSILMTDPTTGAIDHYAVDLGMAESIRLSPVPRIAHVHVLPTSGTLSFLKRARMRPVILWRDLADSMVSFCRMFEYDYLNVLEAGVWSGIADHFHGTVPSAFIERFMLAGESERYDLIIDLALPWYCQFIAGWREIHRRQPGSLMMLAYDALASDEAGTVESVLRYLGIERDSASIDSVISQLRRDAGLINLDVGRSGRGSELLSSQQRQRIGEMWSAYADLDPSDSKQALLAAGAMHRGSVISAADRALRKTAALEKRPHDEAFALLGSAAKRLAGLAEAGAAEPEMLKLLAQLYTRLARALHDVSDPQARHYFDRAIAVYAQLQAGGPSNMEYARALASVYADVSRMLLVKGEQADASRYFASAGAVHEHALQQGASAALLMDMATTSILQADTQLRVGDAKGAIGEYRRALAILGQLHANAPNDEDVLLAHLQAYHGLANAFAALGERHSEAQSLVSATVVLGQLQLLDPNSPREADIASCANRAAQLRDPPSE